MPVQLIQASDTFGSAYNKVNNNAKLQVVGGSMDGNTLKLLKQDGSTINVVIPIPTTGGEVLSPVGSLTLGTSGIFNRVIITPVEYLYNSLNYSILTTTTLNLTPGDATFDRIVAIYIDTDDNTIKYINGTPNPIPVLPELNITKILVGAIYVKQNANNNINGYKVIYSAFNSQNVELQIEAKKIGNNGLSETANNIQLGGELVKNTVIDANQFKLEFNNINEFKITNETNVNLGVLTVTADQSTIQNVDYLTNTQTQLINTGNYLYLSCNHYDTEFPIKVSELQLYKEGIELYNQNGNSNYGFKLSGNLSGIYNRNKKIYDIEQNTINDTAGRVVLDVDLRRLKDITNVTSIDVQDRLLRDTSGISNLIYSEANKIGIIRSGGSAVYLQVPVLDGNHFQTLQSKDGTVALTSDIPYFSNTIVNTNRTSLQTSSGASNLIPGARYRIIDYGLNSEIDYKLSGTELNSVMYVEMIAKNKSEFEEYSTLNYYNHNDCNYGIITIDDIAAPSGSVTSILVGGSIELLNNPVSYTGVSPFYITAEYIAQEINSSGVTNNTPFRAKSTFNTVLIYNREDNQYSDTIAITGITPKLIQDFSGNSDTIVNTKVKVKYDINADKFTEAFDNVGNRLINYEGVDIINFKFNTTSVQNNTITNTNLYKFYFNNSYFSDNDIIGSQFSNIVIYSSDFTNNTISQGNMYLYDIFYCVFNGNFFKQFQSQEVRILGDGTSYSNVFENNHIEHNIYQSNYDFQTIPFIFKNTTIINKKVSIQTELKAFSGGVNNGQANSPVYITMLPLNMYLRDVIIRATSLNGTSLKGGFETDDDDAGFTSISNSTLNSNVTTISSTVNYVNQPTVAFRWFIVTPLSTNITTGGIRLVIEGYISN